MKKTMSNFILHNKNEGTFAINKIPSLEDKSNSLPPTAYGAFDIISPYYDDDGMPFVMCHNKDDKMFKYFKINEGCDGLEEIGEQESSCGFDMVICFRHPDFDNSACFCYDFDSGHAEFGFLEDGQFAPMKMFDFEGRFRTVTVYYDKHKHPHLIVHSQYGWTFNKICSADDLPGATFIWQELAKIEPGDLPVQNVSHFMQWTYHKKSYFFAYAEESGDSVVFKLGKDCHSYQEIWKDNVGATRFNIICPIYIRKKTLFICGNMCGCGGGECYYYQIGGDGLQQEKEECWEVNEWTRFSSFQMPLDNSSSSDWECDSD